MLPVDGSSEIGHPIVRDTVRDGLADLSTIACGNNKTLSLPSAQHTYSLRRRGVLDYTRDLICINDPALSDLPTAR